MPIEPNSSTLQIAGALRSPLLRDLLSQSGDVLLPLLQAQVFAANELIYWETEASGPCGMYVILTGEVSVVRRNAAGHYFDPEPAPAPDPEPAPPPPVAGRWEARHTGSGDVQMRLHDASTGTSYEPGEAPAGTYQLQVRWPGQRDWRRDQSVELFGDSRTVISCNAVTMKCAVS